MQAAVDRYEVKASAKIDAAPERVYPILADYNEHRQKPGLSGRIERFMFTRFLRPLYEDELRRIAEYARTVRV